MFKTNEINSIPASYFNIISTSAFVVTLQSKNTKHFWYITHEEYSTHKTCKIYHRHNAYDPYHAHGHSTDLSTAIRNIKSHDKFQLNGRKKTKRKHL